MKNKSILVALLLSFIFSTVTHSDDKVNATTWIYDKVSDVDLLGNSDPNLISYINKAYKNVVINISSKTLSVKNNSIENVNVCSIDYVKIKKTALSYYQSQKTVSFYRQIFKRAGSYLPDDIYVLTSVFPDKGCDEPYRDVIKVNDYLTVTTDQYYVLFFVEAGVAGGDAIAKKEDWSTYCQEEKIPGEFNGTVKYSCFFPGMDLKKAYGKFRDVYYERNSLISELPAKNGDFKIGERIMKFSWLGMKSLKLSINIGSEIENYSFNEQSSGTNLVIVIDSQY